MVVVCVIDRHAIVDETLHPGKIALKGCCQQAAHARTHTNTLPGLAARQHHCVAVETLPAQLLADVCGHLCVREREREGENVCVCVHV